MCDAGVVKVGALPPADWEGRREWSGCTTMAGRLGVVCRLGNDAPGLSVGRSAFGVESEDARAESRRASSWERRVLLNCGGLGPGAVLGLRTLNHERDDGDLEEAVDAGGDGGGGGGGWSGALGGGGEAIVVGLPAALSPFKAAAASSFMAVNRLSEVS